MAGGTKHRPHVNLGLDEEYPCFGRLPTHIAGFDEAVDPVPHWLSVLRVSAGEAQRMDQLACRMPDRADSRVETRKCLWFAQLRRIPRGQPIFGVAWSTMKKLTGRAIFAGHIWPTRESKRDMRQSHCRWQPGHGHPGCIMLPAETGPPTGRPHRFFPLGSKAGSRRLAAKSAGLRIHERKGGQREIWPVLAAESRMRGFGDEQGGNHASGAETEEGERVPTPIPRSVLVQWRP